MGGRNIKEWLQIVANLGIVAGLILVAIQINQSVKITQADLFSRGYELVLQYQIATLGENPSDVLAKAAMTPEELTTAELYVVKQNIQFWINIHSRETALADLGLWSAPDSFRLNALKWHANFTYGANPVARAAWHAQANPDDDFAKVVNSNLPDINSFPEKQVLESLSEAAGIYTKP